MVLVLDECTRILKCGNVKSLRDRLNHPIDRALILKFLLGKKVRTTYMDRNGMAKTFFVGGITSQPAAFLPAYGKLPRLFNISVTAHFYARHRLRLKNSYLPCIIERIGNGNDRFYPLELLEIVDEGDQLWKSNLFTDTSTNSSIGTLLTIDEELDADLQSGRNELTQTDDGW